MKVDVTINHQNFQLGEDLDQGRLERAHFKKVPVVKKLLSRSHLFEKQFVAKECTLTCFDGNFELYPCRERYLDPDRQWKTAVNLFYKDQRLQSVLIKVLDGCYAAPNFLTRFREVCQSWLGEPHVERNYMTRWELENLAVATMMNNDGHNATVLLALDE